MRHLFEAAGWLGFPVGLHAEQLSNSHGAALAASFGALPADHLEYVDEAGVAALARAGTVAVLLPGAFYFHREARLPPVEMLRRHGVPLAVANDFNPGNSPPGSVPRGHGGSCATDSNPPDRSMVARPREPPSRAVAA